MKRVSRTARRIFSPLLAADEPAKLDLAGVDRDDAMVAVQEVSSRGLVRVLDAPDPIDALYVLTAGARGAFRPTWLDSIQKWGARTWRSARLLFWWYRPWS